MLRLITLLSIAPLLAPILPNEVFEVLEQSRPPQDLSVSPREYALRDLIPDWEPVRALTADEMVRPWSPHQMRGGGFPRSAGALWIPVVPRSWIADWPTPTAREPTGVPSGWWWRPRDPSWHGAWIVLGAGARKASFFTMVTTPLSESDYGSFGRARVIRALYDAIRDREAEKRGVEPAVLDHEAKSLETLGRILSAAEESMARARLLWGQDRYEEALDLLERLIDEDAGTDRERALMRLYIIDTYSKMGELTRALAACREVRPYLEDLGMTRYVAVVDDKIINLEGLAPLAPEARPVYRALVNIEAGNDPAARTWLEKALPMIDAAADPRLDYDARATLAPVYERLGERERAIETARDALARAVELELDAEAAEMRALIARLE